MSNCCCYAWKRYVKPPPDYRYKKNSPTLPSNKSPLCMSFAQQLGCAWFLHKGQIGLNSRSKVTGMIFAQLGRAWFLIKMDWTLVQRSPSWFLRNNSAWFLRKGQIGLNSRSNVTGMIFAQFDHAWFLHKDQIGQRSKVTGMIFTQLDHAWLLHKGQIGLNSRS